MLVNTAGTTRLRYAEDRLVLYREYLNGDLSGSDLEILSRIGDEADRHANNPPVRGSQRDLRFAETILRNSPDNVARGVVIVGKYHASDIEASLRQYLQAARTEFEVTML